MDRLIVLLPALPLLGFVVLALFGRRLGERGAALVGCSSVGASAVLGLVLGAHLLALPQPAALVQRAWTWIDAGGFRSEVAFRVDALSLTMLVVVTCVGFLIHLYSTEFMRGDDGYSRFFAYMNLFVAAMLVLLLADDLLLLFLGWEGVGLCSYLLIGFWYRDPVNGRAARKAFIVTRVGDTAFTIGLFVLFTHLGTLAIPELLERLPAVAAPGTGWVVAAAALLLGGACGKSAQLPLQTWLPDAMAGPTPTSALIHAATMVTAGVYLIARTHVLFTLAPAVQLAVAIVGALTLLVAGCSALAQDDLKRVLAWSTVSQIGYMFLALGVGAWSAALFHFVTHAFFKSLLFLAAGVVIEAQHHEHDMFRMGGLRRALPLAFWAFVIGGSALAGLPLVTSGFYSKDLIVWNAWSSPLGSPWLWAAAIAGVVLTSLYTYRLVFVVFFGPQRIDISRRPGLAMRGPLVVLSVLAIAGGALNLPEPLGHAWLGRFLETVLPDVHAAGRPLLSEALSSAIAALAFAAGLALAWWFFLRRPRAADALARSPLHAFFRAGWGFDALYDALLVRPVVALAAALRDDPADLGATGTARAAGALSRLLGATESGRLRWYVAGFAWGTAVLVALVVLL